MSVNWDAVTGLVLFLLGTCMALGPRWAGGAAMLFGAIYLLRSYAAQKNVEPQ